MSDYDFVCKGKLKIKSSSVEKKKKKSSKEKKKLKEAVEEEIEKYAEVPVTRQKTAAEIAFEKAKEKRDFNEIMKKASKTHKERIMEFNNRLDSLTEHFDIPKVSWTK